MNSNFDVVGIGAGPFNLSVAALMEPIKNIQHIFLEKQRHYAWHPGMLLPNTTIQNSFLKDLVSFADPTSKFSFLSFLHKEKRLYEYINAGFMRTSRREFNLYLQWVASQLASLEFDQTVRIVKSHPDGFLVKSKDKVCVTKNVIVATGPVPSIPKIAEDLIGTQVFHSSQYLFNRSNCLGKRVVVIGGGQSGAEIVLDLLKQVEKPIEITWISSRTGFLPLNESHFANELFTPAYVTYFWHLSHAKRLRILESHKLASDGISPETIEELYQRLYEIRFLEEERKASCNLMCSRVVYAIEKRGHSYQLEMTNKYKDTSEVLAADCIILATGYLQNPLPSVLKDIEKDIEFSEERPVIGLDFSLNYTGKGKLFLLNASRHSHGISEPNLSVSAWRAATVINAILGYEHYPSPQEESLLTLSLREEVLP